MRLHLPFLFTVIFFLTPNAQSQCVATNQSSTDDYSIQITASIPDVEVIGDYGTTWNIQFSYNFDISYSGTEIPQPKGSKSILYNLQTYLYCDHIENGETYIDNLESIENGGNATLYSPIKQTVDYISAIINKPSINATYEDFGCTLMTRMSGPGIADTFVPFICNNTILPIELDNFSVSTTKLNYVKINWTTNSEKNNDFFTIERATNNIAWEEIVRIKGAGSANCENSYQFIDKNAKIGENYYRLKQTDFSGVEKTFPPKHINIKPINKTNLYPTTVTNFLTINNYNGDAIQIYSSEGKLQLNLTKKQSGPIIKIDAKNLERGIYYIKIGEETLQFNKN